MTGKFSMLPTGNKSQMAGKLISTEQGCSNNPPAHLQFNLGEFLSSNYLTKKATN